MHVHICIYVYIHTHINMYIYICMYMHTYIYVNIYIYIYIHSYALYIHVYVQHDWMRTITMCDTWVALMGHETKNFACYIYIEVCLTWLFLRHDFTWDMSICETWLARMWQVAIKFVARGGKMVEIAPQPNRYVKLWPDMQRAIYTLIYILSHDPFICNIHLFERVCSPTGMLYVLLHINWSCRSTLMCHVTLCHTSHVWIGHVAVFHI